jgi:hypothetical protein
MPPLPLLAIITTALLAVAVRNVWFSLLSTGATESKDEPSPYESLPSIGTGVVAYLLLFIAMGHILTQMPEGTSTLFVSAIVFVLLAHQHVYQAASVKKPLCYVAVHAGYAAIIAFGGIAVLQYWPW